jgi:hypothetical protein
VNEQRKKVIEMISSFYCRFLIDLTRSRLYPCLSDKLNEMNLFQYLQSVPPLFSTIIAHHSFDLAVLCVIKIS